MHFHTGTHVVAQLFGMSVNLDTIFTQWLTALIVFIIVFAASRGRSLVPNGIQNAVEMVIEPLCSQFERNMGSHYKKVVYFLLTLFLFIFVANEIGLLPTAHLTASPTNDVNTTLGLALTGTLCIHFVYIRNRGFGKWLKHFFEPMPPFVIINIVEELSRPVTLAMRLFGNSAGNPLRAGTCACTFALGRIQPCGRIDPGIHFHYADVHLSQGKCGISEGVQVSGSGTP